MPDPDATDSSEAPSLPPLTTAPSGSTRFHLLGTAHISQASAEEVSRRIAEGAFDAVAVELCPARYQALTQPDAWADMDLFRVIREGRAGLMAGQLALSAYQQRLAEQVGVRPGAEMKAAVDAAEGRDLPLWCVDRDMGTTLKRLLRGVPWRQRLMLVSGLLGSFLSREEVSEAEIERLKEGDILESTFAELSERSPALYEHLVTERDRYMAARLRQEAEGQGFGDVLVVVGAGHVAGLKDQLERTDPPDPAAERAELDRHPPRNRWLRAIPWAVVTIVAVGFVIGFQQSPATGWQMLGDWVVINGALSALGAALALAHPLTVVGAFVAAPLTSLNPTVGAGMVTAALEAGLRRPRMGDFSHLREAITRLSGWWRNRVARVLLVFVLSSLGSAIGTYVAGFRIVQRLVS
jgi:pheromone shutdown-related protein TraB